jgi:hypothetical protein
MLTPDRCLLLGFDVFHDARDKFPSS